MTLMQFTILWHSKWKSFIRSANAYNAARTDSIRFHFIWMKIRVFVRSHHQCTVLRVVCSTNFIMAIRIERGHAGHSNGNCIWESNASGVFHFKSVYISSTLARAKLAWEWWSCKKKLLQIQCLFLFCTLSRSFPVSSSYVCVCVCVCTWVQFQLIMNCFVNIEFYRASD